jgi:S1-C subfamily serine protease
MFTSLTLTAALALGAPALKDREPEGKGPGYLGITFQRDDGGLIVTDVKPDSPAAKAGVKANDLIVKLDGVSMAEAETGELVKMVAGMRPGTVVPVEVKRGPETVRLKVKLGPRPADFPTIPQRIPPPGEDPRP